jgi:hypothetical protein
VLSSGSRVVFRKLRRHRTNRQMTNRIDRPVQNGAIGISDSARRGDVPERHFPISLRMGLILLPRSMDGDSTARGISSPDNLF